MGHVHLCHGKGSLSCKNNNRLARQNSITKGTCFQENLAKQDDSIYTSCPKLALALSTHNFTYIIYHRCSQNVAQSTNKNGSTWVKYYPILMVRAKLGSELQSSIEHLR